MIGPDDINEQQTASRAPTIALTVAAVLLLAVGGFSYRDYVRSSIEKEFSEKEMALRKSLGLPGEEPAAAAAATPAAAAPAGSTVLYDAQGNPVYLTSTAPGAATNPPPSAAVPEAAATDPSVQSNLPAPEDPEIASMRRSLDQTRKQGMEAEERFNQATSGNGPMSPPASTSGTSAPATSDGGGAEITPDLPDFLRNAVVNPPGGNPEIEAQLKRMRDQVMRAPAIAKVTSYDSEWGIVTFNAGTRELVKVDQRFAVRRGSDVLGWVKVSEVGENQSIATMVTKNANQDTALKPDVGDDLIDFELF